MPYSPLPAACMREGQLRLLRGRHVGETGQSVVVVVLPGAVGDGAEAADSLGSRAGFCGCSVGLELIDLVMVAARRWSSWSVGRML